MKISGTPKEFLHVALYVVCTVHMHLLWKNIMNNKQATPFW